MRAGTFGDLHEQALQHCSAWQHLLSWKKQIPSQNLENLHLHHLPNMYEHLGKYFSIDRFFTVSIKFVIDHISRESDSVTQLADPSRLLRMGVSGVRKRFYRKPSGSLALPRSMRQTNRNCATSLLITLSCALKQFGSMW